MSLACNLTHEIAGTSSFSERQCFPRVATRLLRSAFRFRRTQFSQKGLSERRRRILASTFGRSLRALVDKTSGQQAFALHANAARGISAP